MIRPFLYRSGSATHPHALLRATDDFGIEALDVARAPSRFWAGSGSIQCPPTVLLNEDARRLASMASPASLLGPPSSPDTWRALSRRSLNRLAAWFLITEDPQRRLEAREVATLAHQASLVQHVLREPNLRRVLVADEVGLGKTVEAGLIVRELLGQAPRARILYLAPARLARNVHREFVRLDLGFRLWVASSDRNATLGDDRVIASIHRGIHHLDAFLEAQPWDVVIVDECHHLSDWAKGGGSPTRKFKLVKAIQERLPPTGRLILMSGTPHQGHPARFENLLGLLQAPGEEPRAIAGRVIYRTKEDVRDWRGRPLFPRRQVNGPIVVDLGPDHRNWLKKIHDFFEPVEDELTGARRRAAGWRCGQALQWASSSVQAGLGYLVRQAVRAKAGLELPGLIRALEALRPYRGGATDEAPAVLYGRLQREIGRQVDQGDVEDIEEIDEEEAGRWRPDRAKLTALLEDGVAILRADADAKWSVLREQILGPAGAEKIVFFAQPIETVTALAHFLERTTGRRPAVIVGDQDEAEREREIESFRRPDGPQFLVSSRAGGEGINLQVARRLVHVDVPWNPMELEQRVGRVHRFMSMRTILVDTIVVKDSREVDAYRIAREKLGEIVRTMVAEEKFEALFSRVMALVPPEEMQDLLGERPLGPLSDDESRRLTDLVTVGFERWRSFHDRFADQQNRLRALDPGLATWEDVQRFIQQQLQTKEVGGFSVLGFQWNGREVEQVDEGARVLEIDGRLFACGDYGGMPVRDSGGRAAEPLGLNLPIVADALRRAAFPEQQTGAAQLRWSDADRASLASGAESVGVLAFARHTLRTEQGYWSEVGTTLHVYFVTRAGEATVVDGDRRGAVVRALLNAIVRLEPDADPAFPQVLQREEARLFSELRRPSEAEREARVMHAVFPLFTAIVA